MSSDGSLLKNADMTALIVLGKGSAINGSLVGNGDWDVLVIPDCGAHWGDALHQPCHHGRSSSGPQLHSVAHNKWS